jgi:hypothetical protein
MGTDTFVAIGGTAGVFFKESTMQPERHERETCACSFKSGCVRKFVILECWCIFRINSNNFSNHVGQPSSVCYCQDRHSMKIMSKRHDKQMPALI